METTTEMPAKYPTPTTGDEVIARMINTWPLWNSLGPDANITLLAFIFEDD
jgi:hypothetical protein